MNRTNSIKGWLLPAVLILFLLQVILLPFVVRLTYAGRSESPDHVLTYTTGALTWNSATHVDAQTGAARLSLFQSSYQNVQAQNGDRLVAPGTQGQSIVRLKNDAAAPVRYTAVMYRISEQPELPVAPELEGEGFADTAAYPLPANVEQSQVVRAVTGTLEAGRIQDFDISWEWLYYEDARRDQLDTALGNKAAFAQADEVTAGLYIVVEENTPPDNPADDAPDGSENGAGGSENGSAGAAGTEEGANGANQPGGPSYLYPQVPQTGDSTSLTLYVGLVIVCGVLLLLLTVEKKKETTCKRD